MSDVVLRERRGRTLIITINRPEARNAFNLAVAQGLADAVDELDETPELSVAIITGAGGNFCAGMDLKAFASGELPHVPGRGIGFTEQPPRKPLIAAVEGYALAGGTEIVLATDLVVASKVAKFGIPEVKRGLVAAGGGLLRLPKRIPIRRRSSWRSPATTSPPRRPRPGDSSTSSPSPARPWRVRSNWPNGSPPTGRWPSR